MASARGGCGGFTSDGNSSVSGLVRYSEPATLQLYHALVQNLQLVNTDMQEVEQNLMSVMRKSSRLETHLVPLLSSLPQEPLSLSSNINTQR